MLSLILTDYLLSYYVMEITPFQTFMQTRKVFLKILYFHTGEKRDSQVAHFISVPILSPIFIIYDNEILFYLTQTRALFDLYRKPLTTLLRVATYHQELLPILLLYYYLKSFLKTFYYLICTYY